MNASAHPSLTDAARGGADDCFEWPGAVGRLLVRVYQGAPAKSSALLVFFPPGGFVEVDLDASDECCRSFAEASGVTLLAPSYAVAPERPFPAAVEDAHAVLLHAARRGSRIRGWTGEHLFVGGMEAGGNLAAVSALVCRDRLGPKLAGQILVMPMLDPDMTGASKDAPPASVQTLAGQYRDYLPRLADRVHPYASPLASSRLAGLPPALVIHADGDTLAAGSLAYADKLEHAQVPVHRVGLPASEFDNVDDRCAAAADDPTVLAISAFIERITKNPKNPRRTP